MNISQLYTRGKLFMSFQYHRTFNKPAPLVSLLFLTSKCNFNCMYCFAEHKGEIPNMPIEDWKKIILDLKMRGTKLVFLMGGEPLLYYGFSELVEFVNSLGLMCHVITNGSLVPKFIDTLKKADLVEVSLDGIGEANDKNRGHGTYDKIVDGIESLKKNNIPMRLSCVLTKNNVNNIDELIEFSDETNSYIGFTIPAEPKNEECKDQFLTQEELLDAYRKIRTLTDNHKITLSKKSIDHILNYPCDFDEIINSDSKLKYLLYPQCPYGRFIVFVGASGDIYPCTSLWELKDIFQPKNIFKDGIDEALKNVQNLPCLACICAGGIEWTEMSSFSGLAHALKFSMSQ